MIIECPHCHRTVIPRNYGECPACHKNAEDSRNADVTSTLLFITEATKFPDACCTCNAHTENRIKIHRSGRIATSQTSRDQPSWTLAWLVLLSFGGAVGRVMDSYFGLGDYSRTNRSSLTVYVPQCRLCSATNKLESDVVDLEHCRLGIIVDRNVAEKVENSNADVS